MKKNILAIAAVIMLAGSITILSCATSFVDACVISSQYLEKKNSEFCFLWEYG